MLLGDGRAVRRGNLSGGQRFWEAGGCLGACLLCRWVLLSAWGGKGGAAALLRGGIPPAAAPPPPFHKGGDGLWRVMLFGGKASAQGFCGHGAATRILAFFLLDSAAGFMYNKASGNCDRQVREDGP